MRLIGRPSPTDQGAIFCRTPAPIADISSADVSPSTGAPQIDQLFAEVLETAHAEIAVVDEFAHIVAANGPFRDQFLDGADPTGMSIAELVGRTTSPPLLDVLSAVETALGAGTEITFYALDPHQDHDLWLDVTVTPFASGKGVVLRARDVSGLVDAARLGRAGRLHDPLTGVLSPAGLQEALDESLQRSANRRCVVMLCIDQFQIIRHTLGFAAADDLLRAVARNLQRCLPTGAMIARLEADHFCVTFEPGCGFDVDLISSQLRDAVRQPVDVRGRTVRITASVGSTVTSADTSVELAMQHAELAMQEGATRGGNRCVRYDSGLSEPQEGMVRLWNALRSALQFRQMEVWFQPVVSLATDRPIGAEALCRWHHPQFGDVSPGEFIPIAERNSEILNIGAFVHGRAAETMNALRAARTAPMSGFQISVNASPNELAWPDFGRNMLARIRANEARPEWFVLEVTEAALAQPDDAVQSNIRTLRQAGVTVALDDFGTGYSSLERLHDLPVDRVKIDRRFVAGITTDERSERIVAAIVSIADDLGIDTVAEGVETADQAAKLRSLGCRAAQGFLYAPAVPDQELQAVLRDLTEAATTPRWRAGGPGA